MFAPGRLILPLIALGVACCGAGAVAQSLLSRGDVAVTRKSLEDARQESEAARRRAEALEADARQVTAQADRTAREAAAIAARIQETEAEIAGHDARMEIIAREREELRASLAEREQPLIRLTAALQRLSRRPPVLALLRPGSLRDTVHLRALLETMMPEVERRTAALRVEIEKGHALERKAQAAADELRQSEIELEKRRQALAAVETRQRLASREASGIASRESERALALAEKARDLSELLDDVSKQSQLRAQLAALPGPIMRPARPEESEVIAELRPIAAPQGPTNYILPLSGRLVAGFGEELEGRAQSRGIVLAARATSQAVSPAAGRIAFAGPYSGYGQIVIIEHEGGWTSLVTGLARLDASVGDVVVSGSPLGTTGPGEPIVTVELRRHGEPVNPLQFLNQL